MGATASLRDDQGEVIDLNGLSYFVRDAQTDGEPVLFLHGAPDHGVMWRHQFDAAREAGYRPICPDLLGYGRSERPEDVERYRFDLMASDLVALLRQLSVEEESLHLVAHDFGASLGWVLAGTEPKWLRSYCAMSVGHANAFFGQLDLEHIRWQWNLFLNTHPQAIELFQANDGALFKALISSHPDVQQVYEPFRDDPMAAQALLNWERANHIPEAMAASFAGQLPDELAPRVSVPTLGLWAEEDDFVWEEQMEASGQFVDGEWRYERLQGGHWFMLERPEEVNALLLSWLTEHSSPVASPAQ